MTEVCQFQSSIGLYDLACKGQKYYAATQLQAIGAYR